MTVTLEMNWDTKSMIIPTSIIVNWFYLPSEIMEMVSYVEWDKEHIFNLVSGLPTGCVRKRQQAGKHTEGNAEEG